MLNNRGYNIDQSNRDYDFCHNRAALTPASDSFTSYEHDVNIQCLSCGETEQRMLYCSLTGLMHFSPSEAVPKTFLLKDEL